jgi:hypothetical protein
MSKDEYRAWIVTYKNFRGSPARRIINAKNEREAREDFRAANKGTPEEAAKIISVVEQ